MMKKGLLGANTLKQANRLMRANVFTSQELVEASLERIAETNDEINAMIEIRDKEELLREAEASQKRIEKSKCMLLNFFHQTRR